MKEITLRIPDKKFKFFMELIKQLGLEIKTQQEAREEDYEIPEEHKAIVQERAETTKPEEYIPWEEAQERLRNRSKNKSEL